MKNILILMATMFSFYATAEVTCTGTDTVTYVDAKSEVSHINNEKVIKLYSHLKDEDGPAFTTIISANADTGNVLIIVGQKNSVKSHTEINLLKGQKYMSSLMADGGIGPSVAFQINCENK